MSVLPPGLEVLEHSLRPGPRRVAAHVAPVLVGVLASGNLEVLLEPIDTAACEVRVETSARGYAPIWRAVLDDFQQRHGLSGVRISVHDLGATPAVVSLRLDQAVSELPTQEQA